jgi:hypothetical protein
MNTLEAIAGVPIECPPPPCCACRLHMAAYAAQRALPALHACATHCDTSSAAQAQRRAAPNPHALAFWL